jgi:large subunit ribosomal protein L7/L12
MSVTREQVVAYLEGLDGRALGEFIDELQRRLGVAMAVPERITMGAMPTMGMPIEETECAVVLVGFAAARKVEVMRAIRELRPQMGLMDVKKLVDAAPVTFAEELSPWQAGRLADRLRAAGAVVEVR